MFNPVRQVGEIMKDFTHPWFICGGWAIDLFLGTETRSHHDIEMGLFRADQEALANYLDGWSLEKVVQGSPVRSEPWAKGEYLQLPIHEAYARQGQMNLEILLNETEDQDWLFRRDSRVRSPLSALIGVGQGMPYLNPQFVLLYKARTPRGKDESDLTNTLSKMSKETRQWLREAILTSEGNDHPWLPLISKV